MNLLPDDAKILVMSFLLPGEVTWTVRLLNREWREGSHSPALWTVLRRLNGVAEGLIVDALPLAERRSKGSVSRAILQGVRPSECLGQPPLAVARRPTVDSVQVLVATRSISLETTNAGHDDGVPASALRDVALSSHADHPHVVRYLGAQVKACHFHVVCEFLPFSLASYIHVLHGLPQWEERNFRANTTKRIMRHILEGLKHLHHRGIFHRNLKPENVMVHHSVDGDDAGLEEAQCHVKIGDLSMGRAVCVPAGSYTPEDPKERERSFREQRRLCYRAPELILRAPAYGVEVDTWAAGCIMAELILGFPIFRSDAEIGLLFKMLEVVGTPHISEWRSLCRDDELLLDLPQWQPIDFALVSQEVERRCRGPGKRHRTPIQELSSRYPGRKNAVETLLKIGEDVGSEGLQVLSKIFVVPASRRISAAEALQLPYFTRHRARSPTNSSDADAPFPVDFSSCHNLRSSLGRQKRRSMDKENEVRSEAEDGEPPYDGTDEASPTRNLGHGDVAAGILLHPRGNGECRRPPLQFPRVSPASSPRFWEVLRHKVELSTRLPMNFDLLATLPLESVEERSAFGSDSSLSRETSNDGGGSDDGIQRRSFPPVTAERANEQVRPPVSALRLPIAEVYTPLLRAKIVNAFWWIRSEFSLRHETVHLAAGLFDRYVAIHLSTDGGGALDGQLCRVAAMACMKIADVFNETSKEYYKQDNAQEYSDLINESRSGLFKTTTATPAELLVIEKKILTAVNFQLSLPTAAWFGNTYAALAWVTGDEPIMECLRYLLDISLLDNCLLTFSPALKSQVAILIACCYAYRPPVGDSGHIGPPDQGTDEAERPGLSKFRLLVPSDREYAAALAHRWHDFWKYRERILKRNTVWEVSECMETFKAMLRTRRQLWRGHGLVNLEDSVRREAASVGVPKVPRSLCWLLVPGSAVWEENPWIPFTAGGGCEPCPK